MIVRLCKLYTMVETKTLGYVITVEERGIALESVFTIPTAETTVELQGLLTAVVETTTTLQTPPRVVETIGGMPIMVICVANGAITAENMAIWPQTAVPLVVDPMGAMETTTMAEEITETTIVLVTIMK